MNTPITFEIETLNAGSAMDIGTGKFTAPVKSKGTYFFTFDGLANYPASGSAFNYMQVQLLLNGNLMGTAQINEANVVSFTSVLSPVTLQSTLHLQKGDQIWLQIGDILKDGVLFDSVYHSSHFTGFLIEEDLFNYLYYFITVNCF
ncbi:complement C1q tumor necrosis factor-related protein 3-like [Daphnia pulicaria]|uniref:complement C1q tumor necrosis factor-related protein 3-like n=1 Tax=Daphnia pulicaria TaxID=35523 RepID=UPI001EEC921A|nr:complement C1q tumor necrosis factor-related protein 3-like [Daphnia pulicaria]